MKRKSIMALATLGLAACQADAPPAEIAADEIAATEPSPAGAMNDIADRYYAWTLARRPEQAAEDALGDDFDIREFHDRVLENGTIPLGNLRQHIEAWIEDKQQ